MSDDQPIDVTRSSLGGALRNGPLRVPNHQREYSWKLQRVLKLFDDFNSAMVKRQASYFLGTIVLTPGRPPNVIDGQQRLATTTIFLAAARDALIRIGREDDAKSIEDDFLFKWDRTINEHVPRLSMNIDDREFMQTRVLNRPADRKPATPRLFSHRMIDLAANAAASRVAAILESADTPPRKLEAINAWIEFIDRTAVLVMLTPPSAVRAFQMFKTLNDRAQRTTQADMIKNHLFEQSGESVDEAQSKWSSMRSTIEGLERPTGDDPLLTYLHHVGIVFYGPVAADDIFEKLESSVVGRAQSLSFLEALARYGSDYAAIVTPSHAKWGTYDNRVRTYIAQISQEMHMSFLRPVMLAIANRFSATETRDIFRACVSWVMRFLVAGGHRSGSVEKAVGECAHAIERGEIATAVALAEAFKRVVPNDTIFHEAFLTKTITNAKQARFILHELEGAARGGTPHALTRPVTDTSQVSLEHILPKNPESKAGWEQFSVEERRLCRNRLGNMILIDAKDNGAIGDKPFSEKRPVIERSKHFWLTLDVLDRTEGSELWTKANIEQRQKRMADLAVKLWPVMP